MGNKQTLSPQEITELCHDTSFTPVEIKRIYKRFISLDSYKRGYVSVQDLLSGVPEVENNPLGERICKVFTTAPSNHNSDDSSEVKNMIDFKEFVKVLSTFNN
jgi:serine/threonine-protein phosphatase 2B regulatory subunit